MPSLDEAPDEKIRAKLIAETIEAVEERYPHLRDLATQGHLRESELRLQKEIQALEVDIKGVEAKLQKEMRTVEANLTRAMHVQTR